jgi:hypothetical protein
VAPLSSTVQPTPWVRYPNFMGESVTEVMSASFGREMYNRAKIVRVTARCNCWDIVELVIGDGGVR